MNARSFIPGLLLTFLFVAECRQTKAQVTGFGIGVEALSSGNCHGTFVSPFMGYELGRHFAGLGPLVHMRSGMVKGLRAAYSLNLSSDERAIGGDLIQLHLLAHAQYNAPLPLSAFVESEERMIARGNDVNWSGVQLATAEAGTAIEVRVTFSEFFAWRISAGSAVHYHTQYHRALSRDRLACSLSLNTGLIFFMRE